MTTNDLFAAEDQMILDLGVAMRDYDALIAELDTFAARIMQERRTANNYEYFYLTDTNVDDDSVMSDDTLERGSLEYWKAMYSAASFAAGMRAEEDGIDINAALGKIIY